MVVRMFFVVAVLATATSFATGVPVSVQQRGSKHPSVAVLQRVPVVGRCVDLGTGVEAPYEGELDLTTASDRPEPWWGGLLHLPDQETGRQLDATLDAIVQGQRRVSPPPMVSLLDIGGPPGAEPITIEGVGSDLVLTGRDENWISFVVRCTLQRR